MIALDVPALGLRYKVNVLAAESVLTIGMSIYAVRPDGTDKDDSDKCSG